MGSDPWVSIKASDLTLLLEASDQVLGDYSETPVDWSHKHRLAAAIGYGSLAMELAFERDECPQCKERESNLSVPSHAGSPRCGSGSIASGGKNAHCTCDTCY